MTKLQRVTIILAAFGVLSILLTQTNSHSSNTAKTAASMPSATVNIDTSRGTQQLLQHTLLADPDVVNGNPNIVTNIYQSGSGSFYFERANVSANSTEYEAASLESTSARITVTGPIARTRLTQVFSNVSDQVQTGVYVFPLPQDAAVDHLLMQVGDRTIEGVIKRKDIATKMFKQAKSQGTKASLVSQLRPNIFTNQVANIPPKSSIAVTIEYQQFVVQDKHNYALRLPLSITPRYQPSGLDTQNSENNLLPPEASEASTYSVLPAKTHISVRLNTGLPINHITSEHHPIKTLNTYSTQYEIELDTEQPANKDFVLNWQLKPSFKVQASHFSYQSDNHEYGLITLLPPTSDGVNAKRNLVFILDVSGSMVGDAIMQAKQSLALAIEDLQTQDYFNIIAFSSEATKLWSTSQQATQEAKNTALHHIYTLEADGGTEIKKALEMAFALPAVGSNENTYLNQLIFITDGSVSNEDELMQTIYQQLGQYRLFTVGIGSAPNAYFMSEAATAGKGTFTFIGDISMVKPKMQRLLERLKRPALTNIKLNIKDAQQAFGFEIYPSIIPDLYAGEPLVISYRREIVYSNMPSSLPFSITGEYLAKTEDGRIKPRQWSRQLPSVESELGHGIHKYWARLKIKDLRQQLNMKGRFSDDYKTIKVNIQEAITNVALSHNLVSQYTSLIAIDQSMSELAIKHNMKNKNLARYAQAQLPKTATPSLLFALIGGLMMIISGGYFGIKGKYL